MKLGFFPAPYPDELLFSICARYADRVQYPNKLSLNLELLGNINSKLGIAFPRHLGHLIKALPSPSNFTVERIIGDHTLFHFYRPFLPINTVDRIIKEMARSNKSGSTISIEAGISTIRRQDWLRYCPICVEDDRREFGECFWHRLHQAAGVEVCMKHAVFLENSIVRARFQETQDCYSPAERVVLPTLIRRTSLSDSYHQMLMRWASNVTWLLQQYNLRPSLSDLSNGYLSVLAEKGLVKQTGSIRKTREGTLAEAFNKYFPPAFLDMYEPNRGGRCNKPYQSIRRLLRGHHVHPTHHLLMIEFLGYTVESFFEKLSHSDFVKDLHKPFGNGLWPCLNPASSHFRELKVNNCRAIKSESSKGAFVGIFACVDCGFTYMRTGPDHSPSDRLRYKRVKTYGPVWDEVLVELWNSPSISTIKIAKRLGVTDKTIIHQAIRLGLHFPRLGPGSSITHANTIYVEKYARRQAERLTKLQAYRKAWLCAQKENPGITRTELARRLHRIYSWLYLHDRVWLDANKPPPNYSRDSHRIDWESRDLQLSEEIRREASRLKTLASRPARVTRALIARSLNKVQMLSAKALKNLPLTAKTLSEVGDSPLEFLVRRLKWTVGNLEQQNIPLSKTALRVQSGIHWSSYDKQIINAAFDALSQSSVELYELCVLHAA